MKRINQLEHEAPGSVNLSPAQIEAIIRILNETVAPASIMLFGSAAKGTFRPDSDLDLAYIPNCHRPGAYERFQIAATLADVVGREVDLVDFEQASPVFRAQIIDGGILLYETDALKRQLLFMRSLKEYAMLNAERSEIIQNRMREGRT
ncbi:type VII toxin-antitoxin system MntA family adenylyltransferase antitoxin [Paenibacillus glufosinatiresistens]|uniref:type VII toxin-antitoxin system MntA family adenylyltransferase antitoxin n=1 Tax=Paenibacillus glufosinatiresistens TaxID=3070657 RepID=UPI00286D9475|nr:nucleotidyltransferase domain-containing protein [Paenibacillus sp. YX.27]